MPPGEPLPEQGLVGKPRVSLRAKPPLEATRLKHWQQGLEQWTKHCSERERRAEEIENDAAKVKALEYMRGFLGEEFDGYVTSVLNWGIFVELVDMPIDGLVHIRKLNDDFYEFDEERMILVGKEFGGTFKLGDKVRVQVENVNLLSLELDFLLQEKYLPPGSAERIGERHRAQRERATRHETRRPRPGGFQSRGRKKR
jgi:ribonuclease R